MAHGTFRAHTHMAAAGLRRCNNAGGLVLTIRPIFPDISGIVRGAENIAPATRPAPVNSACKPPACVAVESLAVPLPLHAAGSFCPYKFSSRFRRTSCCEK
eukprot:GFKZ01007628.1.p2 GENE.GFKZ01007628.1~~GFKZ01007628.1.p2  ORF type:complete len:101 (-),score=1.39 GFKZ01007628.1:133-435(-)